MATCLAVMTLVQVYVAGSVESWTVAGAFGQRRFVALTVVMTIGIAALLAATGRRAAADGGRRGSPWRWPAGGTSRSSCSLAPA